MTASPQGPLLLCYDGSQQARHAIESAAGLLVGRTALALTVWQPLAGLRTIAWSPETTGMIDYVEFDRAAAEDGDRLAEDGVRIAHDVGLEARPVAVKATGPVWKTIIEIADRHDAAVIVMGSRGLTGLASMLLGSVSSAVLHHADRPALVMHQPGDT
jgi:nucleotide-binding universal stress UspA family protein